jgi:hypothetical protein
MMNSNSTFIWQGRIHLGDEPGIYGNANYSGLSMEFPFTIKNFDPANPYPILLDNYCQQLHLQ